MDQATRSDNCAHNQVQRETNATIAVARLKQRMEADARKKAEGLLKCHPRDRSCSLPLAAPSYVSPMMVRHHAALMDHLANVVMNFWRTTVPGYTAADLESARISAIEETLKQPTLLDSAHDNTRGHHGTDNALSALGHGTGH